MWALFLAIFNGAHLLTHSREINEKIEEKEWLSKKKKGKVTKRKS